MNDFQKGKKATLGVLSVPYKKKSTSVFFVFCRVFLPGLLFTCLLVISTAEDVFRTHVSCNREDNMEKKSFGEGGCNFIKSLKR